MNRSFLSAVLGAAVVLGAGVARAEDGQMHVRVTDLNLASQTGAREALQRIRHSAGAFCQADEGKRPLGVAAQVNACVARMSGKAVASLNAPLVTALYEGKAAPSATVLASADR